MAARFFAMENFGDRVKEAGAVLGGLNALSKAIGMPRRTLGDQISGKFEVKLSFVIDVAKATGFSVNWLATGTGDKLSEPSKPSKPESPSLDETLMRSLAEIAIRAHQRAQLILRHEDIAVEAASLYNELKEKADDIADAEEVGQLLPWLESRLVKRLAKLKADPANTASKRA